MKSIVSKGNFFWSLFACDLFSYCGELVSDRSLFTISSDSLSYYLGQLSKGIVFDFDELTPRLLES